MPQENAIPESHIRLVATPTAGLPAEHSPYYRRLVSAGYKGFLQGNIAGASLYGVLGAGVGLAAAFAIGIATGGAPAFLAIPLFAGYGLLKGSSTFGQIGSNAAQLAEYAEMNERRNALLDRLYETPSKDEAQEIRKLLQADSIDKPPAKLFHFRTTLIGALIGAAVVAGLVYFGGTALAATGLGHMVTGLIEPLVAEGTIIGGEIVAASLLKVVAAAAAVGAVGGAMFGIDRGWIRRWFDVSEGAVHERDYYEKMTQERQQEATRLHRIGQNEMQEVASSIQRTDIAPALQPVEHTVPEAPQIEENARRIETPNPVLVSGIKDEGRVQELQRTASHI